MCNVQKFFDITKRIKTYNMHKLCESMRCVKCSNQRRGKGFGYGEVYGSGLFIIHRDSEKIIS